MRNAKKYVIGIDFGTLSARAVLVNATNGHELASAVAEYEHGVIETKLGKTKLKSHSALQDPRDYIAALKKVVIAVLKKGKIHGKDICGIGTDFTSCTILPVFANGEPLCYDKGLAKNPHAWVKLWKHHAAQPEADLINEVGARRGEEFTATYGGKYSSEWFFSKVLEIVRDAPEVYRVAGRFIEAGDWIVWQLTGRETRNVSAAGFKGMRVHQNGSDWGYPSPEFFHELHPELVDVIQSNIGGEILELGASAGGLTADWARALGIREGTPVAAGNIDAHAGVPACGVTAPGKLVMIMGTSTCHLLISDKKQEVEGICGVVQNGIVSGYWGYEAGQAGVGDMLAWFVEHQSPGKFEDEATKRKISLHHLFSEKAAKLQPGQSGLIALDWWNGNRSVLVDADLSGVLVGLTLQTRPHEIYRALVEATAFGTRQILNAFTSKQIPVDEIYACGGLAQKNPWLMQIYADVLQRPIKLAGVQEASAFGAAMFAAVAAGIYQDISQAAEKMAAEPKMVFKPNIKNGHTYDALFEQYNRLHDYFGRDRNSVLKKLLEIRKGAKC